MKAFGAIPALLLAAACGPVLQIDDNPDPPATQDSFVAGSTGSGVLSFTGFDGNGEVYGGNAVSTVNLATGIVTGGEFDGTLNASRTQISLDGGGNAFLTNPGNTEYVRFFDRVRVGDEPIYGVVGFVTPAADMPTSGASRYRGAGSVVVTDARALYDLGGSAVVIADFGGGTVDIELGTLSGTRIDLGGSRPVSNGGTILIEGSRINGASFSGGNAFAIGTPFGFSQSRTAARTNGAFFGPDADEAAGRIIVDDPAGDVQVLGRFATD